MIIVTSSFSKCSVFEMFSVHFKTKSLKKKKNEDGRIKGLSF